MPTATSNSAPASNRTGQAPSAQQSHDEFTTIPGPKSTASAASSIDLDPPKAPKLPTVVANYQTRWEREKSKARAEGVSIEPKDPKMIGPWIIGEMLGRGASGRVRLARHFQTGKLAAVKILNLHPQLASRSSLANANEKAEKMMLTAEREIAVMKLLDHPNIMKMYDVWSSPNELYLVLEYVEGGELFDYLCSRGSRLPLLEAVSIIKQVLAGVDYCHRFNICHRDLKPENILLTTNTTANSNSSTSQPKQVKIADFGMSTLDSLNGLLRTSCGSPHYASPEIVRGQTYSGSASDIWSCGVILFALLTSRLPFDDPQVNNVLRKVRDGKFTIPEWVVPQGKDLLTKMLEVDINKRITMSEILSHPLLQIETPGIVLPPVPKMEDIAHAVLLDDVDTDLLRNLCIIWREKDKGSMVSRLCSNEKNFEKAFYFLLCEYRDKSFEEYNMDVGSFYALSPSSSSALPTPPHDILGFDRSGSPIKRHFPGRVNRPSIKGSTANRGPSPKTNRTRRNSHQRESAVCERKSPHKSRILSGSSLSNHSTPRRSSIRSVAGETKNVALNDVKKQKSDFADPSFTPGTTKKAYTPAKASTRPRNVSDLSAPDRSTTQAQRRTSAANGAGVSSPRIGSPTFFPNPISSPRDPKNGATILNTVDEDDGPKPVQDEPKSPLPQRFEIRSGPVRRRPSLLTAKLAHTTSSTASSDDVVDSPHLRRRQLSSTPRLESTPSTSIRDSRPLVSGLATHLISKVMRSPTPESPSAVSRPNSTVDHHSLQLPATIVSVTNKEVQGDDTPSTTGRSIDPVSGSFNTKDQNTTALHGLGVFVAASQALPSPRLKRDSQIQVSPRSPNRLTSREILLPPVVAGDDWRLSDFGEVLRDSNAIKKTDINPKNADPTIAKQTPPSIPGDALGQRANSQQILSLADAHDAPVEDLPMKEGSDPAVNTGPIEVEGAHSTWEKLDWTTGSSTSGGSGLNNVAAVKKSRRRPPPLDLRNPYQKDKRSIPYPQLNAPMQSRKPHSPLLSPFMAFTGKHWTGGPLTPPAPSITSSSMTGTANSSTGIGGGRGLFAKLFDWKSPNLHLISTDSIAATKEECARLLKSLNIAFCASEYGGFRCRVEELIDHHGNRVVNTSSSSSGNRSSFSGTQLQSLDRLEAGPYSKRMRGTGVRSAVNVSSAVSSPHSHAGHGITCIVTFVQERGAYSMLKLIHQRMQETWMLSKSREMEMDSLSVEQPLTPVSARPIMSGHRSSPLLS